MRLEKVGVRTQEWGLIFIMLKNIIFNNRKPSYDHGHKSQVQPVFQLSLTSSGWCRHILKYLLWLDLEMLAKFTNKPNITCHLGTTTSPGNEKKTLRLLSIYRPTDFGPLLCKNKESLGRHSTWQAVSPVDSDQAVIITITTTCQAERSVTSQCEYYLDGFWTKHGNYEE